MATEGVIRHTLSTVLENARITGRNEMRREVDRVITDVLVNGPGEQEDVAGALIFRLTLITTNPETPVVE